MFQRLKFFLQCLWYFHLTPNQILERFSNLCVLSSDEPVEVFEFELTGNQANSTVIQSTEVCIAINIAKYSGFVVQIEDKDSRWNEVMRIQSYAFLKSSLTAGLWIKPLRMILAQNLKPVINPLPIRQLKVPNE